MKHACFNFAEFNLSTNALCKKAMPQGIDESLLGKSELRDNETPRAGMESKLKTLSTYW
jgi:hypothetical protein